MKGKEKQRSSHWVIQVFVLAVTLSAALSLISSTALTGAGYVVAVSVLVAFIALGIVFDMIGIAVTAADPRPFHSMASRKVPGGSEGIWLLRNAGKVSSICCGHPYLHHLQHLLPL